ncbi:MAG TPA: TMEM175 family protein [Pyrinomonadaceae bacterium]|jgi:uncharacterized membrane protein|nr:TMEM175 family protein [Pyrinomonadaceae bacterium]
MSENKIAFQIERIAFFSDAVFAIAITLLIIEVHPKVFGPEVTSGEALREFLELIPHLVAVVVSFLLISMHWRRHHQLFGELINFDNKLITLNLLILLSIIFLPFSTGFIAMNYGRFWVNQLTLPFVVYMLNNLACAFSNFLVFNYVIKQEGKLYAPESRDILVRSKYEILYAVIVFGIITTVGIFNHFAGLACFALFALEPVILKQIFPAAKSE